MAVITVDTEILRSLIADLVDAEVADSWKGSRPLEEFLYIEEDLEDARSALDLYLTPLEGDT